MNGAVGIVYKDSTCTYNIKFVTNLQILLTSIISISVFQLKALTKRKLFFQNKLLAHIPVKVALSRVNKTEQSFGIGQCIVESLVICFCRQRHHH